MAVSKHSLEIKIQFIAYNLTHCNFTSGLFFGHIYLKNW